MGYWQKHTRKDLQRVLEQFDAHGWRIEDPPRYYKLKCPCGKHQRTFHLTPSGTQYGLNALKWGQRQPCWKEGEQQ